jgi:Flp pilus assembly pilin Flp
MKQPIMKTSRVVNNRQGAVAVEFAIIALLLVIVLFGVVEFGLFLFNRQVITNASRQAARSGIIVRQPRLNDDEIIQVARNYCQDHLVSFGDPASPSIAILPDERCKDFGCDLEVRVSYQYDFLVLANLGIGPEQITATAVMKME